MKNFNNTLLAVFIVAAGYPNLVSAHEQGGSLGTDASATDYYQVNCFNDSGGTAGMLLFQAINASASGSAPLSVQIVKEDQNLFMSTTDHLGGDQQFSPSLSAVGGSGNYSVIVDKSGPGKVKYNLDFHCETLGGAHTGTAIYKVQDQ